MINPLFLAGGLSVAVGGLALLLFGSESRVEKRRAAVKRPAVKAIASAQADKALRRKQIADGLRELEKASRRRATLRAAGSSRRGFRRPSLSSLSAVSPRGS